MMLPSACKSFLPLLALTLAGLTQNLRAADPTRIELEFFETRIRSILSEQCYECHGSQAEKIKGGLLLDSQAGWSKGGASGPVIVPGQPEASRLIQAIRQTDPDLKMPPQKTLSQAEISDLETWVQMGAPDPRVAPTSAHRPIPSVQEARQSWPYAPLRPQCPPKVKNGSWPRTATDFFVLARLEAEQRQPAPPAPPLVLLRRATFDLTGLPPTPEEIQAFLADTTPGAWERLVDRLLSSPRFGERWGRHWLDVARYADSNGLETNLPYENAWRYRDYVVQAFNSDTPFDQFIRQQLAGDLLPANSPQEQVENWVATGFLVLGPKNLVESDPEKLRLDVVDEQIDVTSRAFLGLTIGCARCHDHKFDPISMRDYYALAGIFHSTSTLEEPPSGTPRAGRLRWRERPIGAPEQVRLREEYETGLEQLREQLKQASERKATLAGGLDPKTLPGVVVDNKEAELTGRWREQSYATNRYVGGNYLHDSQAEKGKKSVRYVPNLPRAGRYEVRLSYIPAFNRATNVPVTVECLEGTRQFHINQRLAPTLLHAFISLGTFSCAAGTNTAVVISNAGTKDFVVADAVQFLPLESTHAGYASLAMQSAPEFMSMSMDSAEPQMVWTKLQERLGTAPPPMDTAMVVKEGIPTNSPLFLRGDFRKAGPSVPRGFPQVLATTTAATVTLAPLASGRLELANWMTSPQNLLTARVAANRLWLHLFGQGLVRTPDNFGAMGEAPSHPELLDYLAQRLMALGWSQKKLIRELMLSHTYAMSARHDATAWSSDPDNRTLWRMPRRRLEAEAIRDAVLQASGELDLKGGGSPYLSDQEIARTRADARRNRQRSLYLPIRRNEVPELFQLFDFADPHVLSSKRNSSSMPTQALYMMNSAFIQEQSTKTAQRLLALASLTKSQRIEAAYLRILSRPPSPQETARALSYLEDYERALSKDPPSDPPGSGRTRSWQSFCHALFASTEFRFIE